MGKSDIRIINQSGVPVPDQQLRELAEKQKKQNGKLAKQQQPKRLATKADIAQYVRESFQYFKRTPPKSDAACARRLMEYFQQCMDEGQMPTVEDMSIALGVTIATVHNWENDSLGHFRGEIIRRAKGIIAGIDAKLVQQGQMPVVSYIFRAKNFYGMRDQTDIVVAPASPLGEEISEDELRKRIPVDIVGDLEPVEEDADSSDGGDQDQGRVDQI